MKKYILILASFFLTGATAFATTSTTTADEINHSNRFNRGYGNSFIFIEQGIEFAVFPDGQFDFNVTNYGPDFGAYADFGGVSISFNSGYSYDAYVQYDDYGAVVQIENIPIYYDHYGRITRAGDVRIRYNNFGRISRVGGLFVHYNRYNSFDYCSGYINVYNRRYVYRPWHTYYAIPRIDFCIVYARPYRQYYRPYRHTYYRPYRNNARPRYDRSYNAGRRNAVAQNTSRRSDRYRQDSRPRRGDAVVQTRPSTSSRGDRVGRTDKTRPTTVQRGRPATSSRNNKVGRTDKGKPTVHRGRPAVTSSKGGRNEKAKPRTQRTRPTVSRSGSQNKRVTQSTRPNTQRKRVSTQNRPSSKKVTQRSQKRSTPSVNQRSRSNVNKSRASRSSSKKTRSATSRRRS